MKNCIFTFTFRTWLGFVYTKEFCGVDESIILNNARDWAEWNDEKILGFIRR